MTDEKDETQQAHPEHIQFHHIKSSQFRVIHIDGGTGGITPRGYCTIGLYSERKVIPRVTVRDISEEGDVGPEHTVETRVEEPDIGIIREVEIGLIFDERTAIEIRDWLNRRLEELAEPVAYGQIGLAVAALRRLLFRSSLLDFLGHCDTPSLVGMAPRIGYRRPPAIERRRLRWTFLLPLIEPIRLVRISRSFRRLMHQAAPRFVATQSCW